jgi:putative endonuclease
MDEKMIGVYIMGNTNLILYTGVTNNLVRRVLEHKKGKQKGFTRKYNLKMCLYYEFCETMRQAIVREKQIKDLDRKDKLILIKSKNPALGNISMELFSLVHDPQEIDLFE